MGDAAQEAPPPQDQHGDERSDVERADDGVEVALDAAREAVATEREYSGRYQQRGADQEPDAREQDQLAVEVRTFRGPLRRTLACHRGSSYLTEPAMEKIGRYMATRNPPTTPPRNTIITGSIML